MSGFGNQDPFAGLRKYLKQHPCPIGMSNNPELCSAGTCLKCREMMLKNSVEKELRKEFRKKYTIRRPYILEAVVDRTVWPCMFLLGMIYAIISPTASVRMIKEGIEQYEKDMEGEL